MIAVIFFMLHLCVCIGAWWMWRKHLLKTRNPMLPVVAFVPVFGIFLLLMDEYWERKKQPKTKGIDVASFKIQDVKYKRITMDTDTYDNITVPFEEAILVNDTHVTRRLMMDILHKNPDQYIDLLQKATETSDTELAHYATTTMMEIQGRYEAELNKLKSALEEEPENISVLRQYRRTLRKYVDSGLLSGNILVVYKEQLDEILEKLCELMPDNHKYELEQLENQILLGKTKQIPEKLEYLKNQWPEEEKIYQLYMEYYWKQGDGNKIKEILEDIKIKQIYLSSEGRQWYEFWSHKRLEHEV